MTTCQSLCNCLYDTNENCPIHPGGQSCDQRIAELESQLRERDAQCAAMAHALERARRVAQKESVRPWPMGSISAAFHELCLIAESGLQPGSAGKALLERLEKAEATIANNTGDFWHQVRFVARTEALEDAAELVAKEARRLNALPSPQNPIVVGAIAVALEKMAAKIRELKDGEK